MEINNTIKLNNINSFKCKQCKKIIRGIGSTVGKTCGKGHNGQKSRSGAGGRRRWKLKSGIYKWSDPLPRAIPKMGFKSYRINF